MLSETEEPQAQPPPNNLDVLAQAVGAAELQAEPKKPCQPRRKPTTLKGGEPLHDDNCRNALKCSLRWELAKIQRKRTYDRQHQEIRTLKRKLGELTAEKENWKNRLNDVTEENIRLSALLSVRQNQAPRN